MIPAALLLFGSSLFRVAPRLRLDAYPPLVTQAESAPT